MSFLKTPFFLGSLELSSNILYAPLAGCSDLPFRAMSRLYHPGLLYCEMVKIEALIRNDPHTYHLLDYTHDMHPIGAQLCGSNIQIAKQAAKIIEDLGFDILDFNCGCPVDKVTKDGSGSAMLRHPDFIGEMLSAIISVVNIPVTVKIRAGWDEQSLCAAQVTKIAEQAGAKAIAIHGRTREQGYKGAANWDWIAECKQVASTIKIIGNGDLFSADATEKMFSTTNCDGFLISRGTMGQPWIAQDIHQLLANKEPSIKTALFIRDNLLTHLHTILSYQTEKQALLDFRRVASWYLKLCEGVKSLKIDLNKADSTADALALIEQFDWNQAILV